MAYDVASGTGSPDASAQMGLMSSPAGGLDNLQASSATGGFVLQPVDHNPFEAQSQGSGTPSPSPSLDLEPADSHGTLTESDRAAMAPYSQGLFDTRVGPGTGDLSGPPGEPGPAPQPEIMDPNLWPDFVSNLQSGEIPFDQLPDKYKEALKGRESDYELMRMGITKPLADLTRQVFDSSAPMAGKEGGRVPALAGPSPAEGARVAAGRGLGLGDVPATEDAAKAAPLAPRSLAPRSGKYPEAQSVYSLLVQGLPDGQGGWKVPPLPPAVAAGAVGNMMQEAYARIDPKAQGDYVKTKAGRVPTAFGIGQWHGDRWSAAQQWTKAQGFDPMSREGQALFYSHEMQSDPGVMAALANARDPAQAAAIIVQKFERAGDPRTAQRQAYANAIFGGNTEAGDNGAAVPVLGFDPKKGMRSSGPQVKTMQSLLAGLGYYHGELDGDFGPKTRAAVKLFQAQNRDTSGGQLKPDGKIGLGPTGKTGNALFQAYANKYGFSDKIQHLLPVSSPDESASPEPVVFGPPGSFEPAGPGYSPTLVPHTRVPSDAMNASVVSSGNRTGEKVRDLTSPGKRSSMPQMLRGWTGEEISSGLTPPSPDSNALFGAPTLPPGGLAAFEATQPVPEFKSTFPARPELKPQPPEPGLGAGPDLGGPKTALGTGMGLGQSIQSLRDDLARLDILGPSSMSNYVDSPVGWPGAGEGVPAALVNEQFPARPEFRGGSEFQTWFSHVKDAAPETYGAIQRYARSKGVSEEQAAREIWSKVSPEVKRSLAPRSDLGPTRERSQSQGAFL